MSRHAAEKRGRGAETIAAMWRDGDELRIDAIFIVPRRWPRHLADVWQG